MRVKFIAFILMTIVPGIAAAQAERTVYGVVKSTDGTEVEDGTVAVFRSIDSSLVAYSTISGGKFLVKHIPVLPCFIKVACIVCKDYYLSLSATPGDTIRIVMEPAGHQMKEVQITSSKNAISYKNGNIKATVEHTALSNIPEAIELLSRLPTVQASADRESISIIGRGEPLIYAGNQRITLSELSTIPVNDIRSIEILNHPPAKYEADGRAVILVTRRTNKEKGVRADLSEAAMRKRYFENRAGISTTLKLEKTEWKANLAYNHATRFEGLDGVLNAPAFNYTSDFNGTSVGPRNQFLFGASMYRQLNATDHFFVGITGRAQKETSHVNTWSNSNNSGIAAKTFTQINTKGDRPFITSTHNYEKNFKRSGIQAFVGGQHSRYKTGVVSTIWNNFNDTYPIVSENRNQQFMVDVATVRVDVKKPFNDGLTWEAGSSVNISGSRSDFGIVYVPVSSSLATSYLYREQNGAFYTQFSGKMGKVDWQAGVRAEQTAIQGHYRDSSQLLVDKRFLYIFPKATIAIPTDSQSELFINYSRSIRRPNYSNANQVTNYITPFLERSNNININPSLTDEVSAGYRYRRYSLEVTALNTRHPSSYVTQYDSTLQKVRMINLNLDRSAGGYISLTVPFEARKFTSNNMLTAHIDRTIDTRATRVSTKPYYYLYSNNQVKLPLGITLTTAGWITTRQRIGVFTRAQQYAVDLSLSKTFMKKLSVTLNALDIFRSLNYVEAYEINGIYSGTTYLENTREYSIYLKYSIGRLKETRAKAREVNEHNNRLN